MSFDFGKITEAFAKIAENHPSKETIDLQLAFLGNFFGAKRVFIIQSLPNGNFSNTYEWCNDGIASEKDVLQNFKHLEWSQMFLKEDVVCMDVSTTPKLKQLSGLHLRKIEAVQLVAMRYNHAFLGFIGMEDVPSENREDSLMAMRYASVVITQTIHTKDIVNKLERIGFKDKLTGLGNRHGLYSDVDQAIKEGSVGVIYADVTGLKRTNDLYGHEAGDRLLVTTAKCFISIFGIDATYRVGGDEFVCFVNHISENYFNERINELKKEFENNEIVVAVGSVYEENWTTDFDLLLKKADLRMYDDKKQYYSHLEQEDKNTLVKLATMNELVIHVDVEKDRYEVLYRNDVELNDVEGSGCYSELINKSFKYIHPDDQDRYLKLISLENLEKYINLENGDSILGSYRRHTINGPYKRYLINLSVREDENNKKRVLVLLKNMSSQDQIRFGGVNDARLDIYHSSSALQRCGLFLAQSNAKKVYVMSIDVNHFRLYNNIYGQSVGDKLLDIMNSTISKTIGSEGISSYIGGDNFIVARNADHLESQEIIDKFETFANGLGLPMRFVPHAGVCIANNNEMGIDELYEKALLAMSRLSDNPFKHIEIYDDEAFQIERDKHVVIIEFEKALKNHEITFLLQPKVDTNTKEIISCEALVRWNENGRMIAARDFIPLLKEKHMISALDLYVWKDVISWLRKMKEAGKQLVPISLNVEIEDFEMLDVASTFEKLLEENQIDSQYIQLEMPNNNTDYLSEAINAQLSKLNELGIVILYDGTSGEYSSLSLLKKSKNDILRVPHNLFTSLELEEEKRLIRDFIEFAKLNDKRVVAEGIETEEQLLKMKDMNLSYAQGYYFYKPISVDEMEGFLKESLEG